jgi:hypothetical protein
MEEMKINSKIRYNRARVRNGHGPHRILNMLLEQMQVNSHNFEIEEEVKV